MDSSKEENVLSEEEEEVIKYLAEMVGPDYAWRIKTNNEEFRELASIFPKYKSLYYDHPTCL